MNSKTKHLGSNFDDFLEEENLLVEAKSMAIKKVLAHEVALEMKKRNLSKTDMARLMQTSRSSLDRLLDPENTSVTLSTMIKAATILKKKLNIYLR